MNFLWDILIRAKQQGKREDELFFFQADEFSPFRESAFPNINQYWIDTNEIPLNLLFRYAEIFQELLAEQSEDIQQFKKYLIDAALHVIVHADLYHGITKKEVYIRRMISELENGQYWMDAAKVFGLLSARQKNKIASLIYSQMQVGTSILLFRKGILTMYPDAILYQVKSQKQQLLLYLGTDKTENDEQKVKFVQDFFLPISYNLRIFWKYHFGIIGVDETMKIDEIAIY